MERRIPWLLLLLVAACFGAVSPFRDKGGTFGGGESQMVNNHIKLREVGAELHAHILSDSFEAGSPQDLAAISFKGLDSTIHKGFQFTSKDVTNVRWYLESDGSRKQRSCSLNGFFWECELPMKLLGSLKSNDQIILRGTIKADSVTEPRQIRKDIMGLPNSEFGAIESIYISAVPRVREIPQLAAPVPLERKLPEIPVAKEPATVQRFVEEGENVVLHAVVARVVVEPQQQPQQQQPQQQQPQQQPQQQHQQPVRRQVVPEHLVLERVRRQEAAEQQRGLEVAARRANAVIGGLQLQSGGGRRAGAPQLPQQQQPQQQQQRRVRELSVSAEDLAKGAASIKRGGISTNQSQQGRQERATGGSHLRGDTPASLKTQINLNFDGMIPENNCS